MQFNADLHKSLGIFKLFYEIPFTLMLVVLFLLIPIVISPKMCVCSRKKEGYANDDEAEWCRMQSTIYDHTSIIYLWCDKELHDECVVRQMQAQKKNTSFTVYFACKNFIGHLA